MILHPFRRVTDEINDSLFHSRKSDSTNELIVAMAGESRSVYIATYNKPTRRTNFPASSAFSRRFSPGNFAAGRVEKKRSRNDSSQVRKLLLRERLGARKKKKKNKKTEDENARRAVP